MKNTIIEFKGQVVNAVTNTIGDTRVCRIFVVTDKDYTDINRNQVTVRTLHKVTAWEANVNAPLEEITEGKTIHVKGRIRTFKYTEADGTKKTSTEIYAKKVSV